MKDRLLNVILPVFSGILMGVSAAFEKLWWISFLGIIPFIFVLAKSSQNYSLKQAFFKNAGFGFLYGITFFTICLSWLNIFGIFALLGAALFQSFFIALFGALSSYFLKNYWTGIFGLPCLWVACDFIRSLGVFGFTWYNIAHLQSYNLSLIQYSSIFGARIIDFFIILIGISIVFKILDKSKFHQFFSVVIITIFCIIQFMGAGFIKNLGYADKIVNIIQGSVSMENKGDLETIEIYKKLSLECETSDLILWGETTLSYLDKTNDYKLNILSDLAKKTNSNLIIGANTPSKTNNNNSKNTGVFISNQGDLLGEYSKMKLVPYGEFVPWRGKIPVLSHREVRDVDTEKGINLNYIKVDNMKVGLSICYESAFPEYARNLSKKGANVLAIITNDWWFGNTFAPKNHFMLARLRAVENKKWILRCASSGISGIISPYGHIITETNLNERIVVKANFGLNEEKTFYTKYGDFFSYICVFIAIFIILCFKIIQKDVFFK